MIPFFRKIRKKMADDDKPLKYMRYAVGEIILVVIGILIALSINNWNEKSIASQNENKILIDLKLEFEENQNLIHQFVILTDTTITSADSLLEYTLPISSEKELISIDFLVASIVYIPKYNPVKGVYNSIINSGNIKLIKNSKLSYMLSNWDGKLDEYNYWMAISSTTVMSHILPYLYKNYNLKNYIVPDIYRPLKKSNFKFNTKELLGNREFENLIVQRRLIAIQTQIKAGELYKIQSEIIKVINSELNR